MERDIPDYTHINTWSAMGGWGDTDLKGLPLKLKSHYIDSTLNSGFKDMSLKSPMFGGFFCQDKLWRIAKGLNQSGWMSASISVQNKSWIKAPFHIDGFRVVGLQVTDLAFPWNIWLCCIVNTKFSSQYRNLMSTSPTLSWVYDSWLCQQKMTGLLVNHATSVTVRHS